MSRGGLRVVLPATAEAHSAESRRHFNECFSLASAQPLKHQSLQPHATTRTPACLPPPASRPATPRIPAATPRALRWAQQLKNKDIPEGGSKAVCLVTPTAGIARDLKPSEAPTCNLTTARICGPHAPKPVSSQASP